MKKIIIIVFSVIIATGLCLFLLVHYFGINLPIPIGYKNGHIVVYSFACADICPQYGNWYKKYYGKISQDECVSMGGSLKLVGFGGGWYDGCEVK